MSDSAILDLDQLAPEPKRVKVQGKVLEVHPPKLKQFIQLQKVFLSLEAMKPEEQIEQLDKLMDTLKPIVPEIESVDLTIDQLSALLEFALSQPKAPQEIKKGGQPKPQS